MIMGEAGAFVINYKFLLLGVIGVDLFWSNFGDPSVYCEIVFFIGI